MNIELVDSETLMRATALMASGKGVDIQEAVAILLKGKEAFKQDPNAKGGKNCSLLLSKALKTLHEDPLLALGLDPNSTAEEAAIKKNYHKLALKYHPDKCKDTGMLFQAAHSAYNLLMDPDKRAAWERRRKKQDESLEQLRKRKDGETKKAGSDQQQSADGGRKASSATSPSSSSGPTGSTAGSGGAGSHSEQASRKGSRKGSMDGFKTSEKNSVDAAEEQLREFNKKFYDEFRKAARSGAFRQGSGGPTAAGGGTGSTSDEGRPQAPPRPKGLRSTGRTETSVTLEWNQCTSQGTVAYELQWRERGQNEQQWQTSQQLILGAICLKKNLKSGVCYEFRVRAASAWGWSGYSDPIMVLTAGGSGTNSASATPRRESNDSQPGSKSKSERDRRQSRAAEEEASTPWTWSDGQDHTSQAAARLWVCNVCRRENQGALETCAVCFTKKDYKPQKLNNISPNPSRATSPSATEQESRSPPPSNGAEQVEDRKRRAAAHRSQSGSASAIEVETDEEAAEDAWEYSEKDVDDLPAQEVEETTESAYYDEDGGDGQDQIYRLNTQVTKLHNVRAEPIKTAVVVGHIFADRDVIVQAEVGPWLKVVWHQAYSDEKSGSKKGRSQEPSSGTGWCLKEHQGAQYLLRAENPARPYHASSNAAQNTAAASKKNKSSAGSTAATYVQHAQERVTSPQQEYPPSEAEAETDVWYELKDENGDTYYFNIGTGSSQWEPPVWWDEVDPASGAVYYRNSVTGITQWEKPEGFAPVIRAEVYSTPEADFVKSLLSPHRSFRKQPKSAGGGGGAQAFSFENTGEPGVIN